MPLERKVNHYPGPGRGLNRVPSGPRAVSPLAPPRPLHGPAPLLPLPRLETVRLITPNDLPPTRDDFAVIGTFNPGAIQLDDGRVVLLVRVAERPAETRDGYVASPRYTPEGEQVIDWIEARPRRHA